MNIEVNGKQYVWQFTYPRATRRSSPTRDMYVPVGMTVTLDIRSDDVQHSWWIPELGGKMDALPGYTNKTWFKVTEAGVYQGQCAELCGRNHANMLRRGRRAAVRRVAGLVRRRGAGDQGRRGVRGGAARAARAAEGEDATQGTAGADRIRQRDPSRTMALVDHAPPRAARPQIITSKIRPEPKGWTSWITTTDHKKIGILYLWTVAVFFVLGGVEALLIRAAARRAGEHAAHAGAATTSSSPCTARRWSSSSSSRCGPAWRTTCCR